MLSGCTSLAPPPPSTLVRNELGVVSIVPAQYVPASNFNTFAKGSGAGAAKGAAILGGTSAGATLAGAAAAGPMAPVVVFAGILATVEVAVLGAVGGAKLALPANKAKEVESAINEAVANLDAQTELAERLAKSIKAEPWIRLVEAGKVGPNRATVRPAYTQLHTAGIDTVIEIAISEIGFESCGPEIVRRISSACPHDWEKPLIDLFMSAQVRLVRVSDGKELFMKEYRYKSAMREIPRWVADGGKLLGDELQHAYDELAERVRDDIFFVTSLALPAPSSFGRFSGPENPGYGICWLAPVYPKASPLMISEMLSGITSLPAKLPPDVCPASGMHFPVIDSLRPTLRWGTFPREIDRQQLDHTILNMIGNVTYDLKIWQAEGCERGWLIYERTGLPKPEHTMEISLAPARQYFWSVRTQFIIEGRPSVTHWALFDPVNCFPNDVADWQYHRFVTPQQE